MKERSIQRMVPSVRAELDALKADPDIAAAHAHFRAKRIPAWAGSCAGRGAGQRPKCGIIFHSRKRRNITLESATHLEKQQFLCL